MPVIKHNVAERLTRSAIVLDLGDLKRQGQLIIEQAEQEAAAILAAARAEAADLVANADARGYADGRTRGEAEGRASGAKEGAETAAEEARQTYTTIVEAWSAMLTQWEAERAAMLMQAREDVLEFAVALAARVVHRIVEIDPAVIDDQLATAVELLAKPTALTIVANPDDRERIEAALPGLLGQINDLEHVRVVDDPTVTRGGCLLKSGRGRIDATIETQLNRIAENLISKPRRTMPDVTDEA